MMSSVRLYLLPEYTTEGRQHYHGEVSSPELRDFCFMNRKILCDARIVEGCLKPILMRIYCASYQLKLNAFFSKVIVKEAKSFKFGKEGEVGYM